MTRTLDNVGGGTTTMPEDIETIGNPDAWQLICKAWSKSEGWMKSTKVMELPRGFGCLVQVTTQQGEHVAESVTFVPGVKISAFLSKK